jgi:putative spermidine/putrescine transport system substrate-binding protein
MEPSRIIETPAGRLGRRRFLVGTVAVASAASWPLVLTRGQARAAEQIVVPSWGGRYAETLDEAFYKPFTKETGIPVVVAPPPDLAKIKAMVKAGSVEYDVVDTLVNWVVEGDKEGLWEPIDTRIVDRTNVVPAANRPNVQGYYLSGGGIIYHEQRHGRPEQRPRSWAEYWNAARFPGRRVLVDNVDRMLAVALMADGADPAKLYPLDVERAFKSLEKVKPHVKLWTSSAAQAISTVEQNESDFNFSYNGRVFASRLAGNQVGFVDNQCVVTMGHLAVPRGARNKEAGMKLINYCLKPERQGAWANVYGYLGTNRRSAEFVKPEVKSLLLDFSGPSHHWIDLEYWGEHNAALSKRFKEWLLT